MLYYYCIRVVVPNPIEQWNTNWNIGWFFVKNWKAKHIHTWTNNNHLKSTMWNKERPTLRSSKINKLSWKNVCVCAKHSRVIQKKNTRAPYTPIPNCKLTNHVYVVEYYRKKRIKRPLCGHVAGVVLCGGWYRSWRDR